ncbi:MAG: hypothetical protein ACRD22_02750 [Terriglobia bacterium]
MTSARDIPARFPADNSEDDPYTPYILRARERWDNCVAIAAHARSRGLDATPEKVNFNYRRWVMWSEGRLATGYLMRMTGVTRIRKDT